ncbi:MAG: carboxypeptidase regulatory-like domain-containing protein, partial [Candidatus Acidiferrales bacterium]
MKILRSSTIFVLGMFMLPLLARAQDTGYITGLVTDASGAAVIGAQVTVTNEGHSLRQVVTTNGNGEYVVAGLRAGTYSVEVSAKGFKKFLEQKVVLAAGEKRSVDVKLEIGSLVAEVIVESDAAPAIETQSSELSTTITGKQVTQLELNGRNFSQLIILTPGVSNQTFSETGTDEGQTGLGGNVSFSVNGGRTEY